MIKKIELEYMYKRSVSSNAVDGVRHIKTLPYLSIVQAVEGDYDIQLGNGEIFNTGKGGFFIAPPDVRQTIVHNADRATHNMRYRWVLLKIKVNGLYSLECLYDLPVIISDEQKKEMNAVFDRLFATDDIFEEYVCYYEIVRSVSTLLKEKTKKMPPYLDTALNYIKNHYKEKITVQTMAQAVNISESYFFSVFKKTMGISPMSYLNNYRLSVAVEEMLKTDKTITEISNYVGISDSVYFNKMFRKAYQMSPSRYREINKPSKK